MTLPPPTLTRRSAPLAALAASSTALPGVCWPTVAYVPACVSPSSASTRRTRSVFSLRERPVTTTARPMDRASSSSFSRLPTPKCTRLVGRNVWVPLLTGSWYCFARLAARVELLARGLEGQVRGSRKVAGLVFALHPVMIAAVGG